MEALIKFIIKYIWVFCVVLILMECVSTVFNASVLMKRTSAGVMQATCGEISSRVDSILKLITGLSNENFISDTSQTTFDRAVSSLPLQQSYDLFMIGVTDKEGYVSSADQIEPDEKAYNLMHRDYMQKLYSTGKYQVTDPIVAGSDNTTVNYTIAVPIMKGNEVGGTIFGSIYFDEIQAILDRSASHKSNSVYLFGNKQTIISKNNDMPMGATFAQLSENSIYFGTSTEKIYNNILEKKEGSYWLFDKGAFYYVLYRNIAPTEWTLLYCTDFLTMIEPLLPVTIVKMIFYLGLCLGISVVGRKFLNRQLSSVTHLLDKMSSMQMQLFQADSADYSSLLDISQSGLVDELTGLPTRTLFSSKIKTWKFNGENHGAVMFIDLDNLKGINDTFGHEAGDAAILCFADILKKFESNYQVLFTRYGGDEFILIIQGNPNDDMKSIGKILCAQMSSEIILEGGNKIPVNASIGIAIYPQDGDKLEDLICKADLALYDSKRRGKNCCSFYCDEVIT